MSNEKLKNVILDVDLDTLNKGNKQLVREITDILDKNPKTDTRLLAETLRIKYNIDHSEIMPIEGSMWHNFSKGFNLGDSIGGFIQDYSSGKRVRVPYLNFSSDLRTLNAFVQYVFDAGYNTSKVNLKKDDKK